MPRTRRSPRLARSRLFTLLVGACLLALAAPWSAAEAQRPAAIDAESVLRFQVDEFPNRDNRAGSLAPGAEQLRAVADLGAAARWNRFGTPRSLIKHGGFLSGPLGGEPAAAVRGWLLANRSLFKLSALDVAELELVHDIQLVHSDARALLFRQRFGDYAAINDGLVAVGYAGGRIAYAAASTAPWDRSALPPAALSPVDAWRIAAADVGRAAPLSAVSDLRAEAGWSLFTVAGFAYPQRARLRALPTPADGVRLVYDTLVLHALGGDSIGVSHLIDAQTGALLLRVNRKQHLGEGAPGREAAPALPQRAPETRPFNGAFAAAACGPAHAFPVVAGRTSITVIAAATLATNDIVLQLYFEGGLVASQDTATSPEAISYAPRGGVPAGAYEVRVCPFGAPTAPNLPPYTYAGTFTTDDAPIPSPIAYPPKWKFFEANPPLDYATTDTRITRCWENTVGGQPAAGCDPAQRPLKTPASNAVWDVNARVASAAQYTTLGNNAQTAESWYSFATPSAPVRPVAANREYLYDWTNQWHESQCSPAVFTSPQRNDSDAATANLFALHNRMHDWSYGLGFTEEAYNLQDSNLGNTTADSRELDPEIGNVQAGAVNGGAAGQYMGRDNANQITLQDGIPGITNMFLWQPIAGAFYAPCADGDYDMSVVAHEYGHAIQNRMVGGPDDGLGSAIGGSMGESWADLTAIEYLNGYGLVPTADENPFAVGPYVTGNNQRGIRNYGMNYSPLNYSNVQYDGNGTTSPHADGEIWSAVNFRIRHALIQKYNPGFPAGDRALQIRCADARVSPEACPGNRRWAQLFHDAFLLMLPGVTMDDARDAYLAADLMRFGGANQAELWAEFARRGLGAQAFSVDGDHPDPVPSFYSPLAPVAAVTFSAVADEPGSPPVDARIYVGQYEARSVPVADTDPTTPISLSNGLVLSETARFLPGSYEFVAVAPGHGAYRFTRALAAGQSTVALRLPTNWASSAKGATVTGNGAANDANLDKLIDDTEATNWARLDTTPISQTTVTVDLGGSAPRTINRLQVSAANRPTDAGDPGGDTGAQGRFSPLRQFAIWVCVASPANSDCADGGGFRLHYTSPENAFPGVAPRPAAPDLLLREFPIAPVQATHVRLQVLSNQCTGGPQFQGEQDADPADQTDCDSGTVSGLPITAGAIVRAAELQIFAGPDDLRRDNGIYLPLLRVER